MLVLAFNGTVVDLIDSLSDALVDLLLLVVLSGDFFLGDDDLSIEGLDVRLKVFLFNPLLSDVFLDVLGLSVVQIDDVFELDCLFFDSLFFAFDLFQIGL